MRIVSRADAQDSRWTFSIDTANVRWDHRGRDLDELKRQFNQLLRELMKVLGQEDC